MAQCYAVQRGDVIAKSLGAPFYAPELRLFLKRLSNHPAATKPLRSLVEINPSVDLSGLVPESTVSFVPMESVEDGATGVVQLLKRPLGEVQRGYTVFAEGDILWAKITPCMQNGKSCIARGLQNGIGFGSTEFHVFRLKNNVASTEFVWEFLNQETLRRVATYAFTGSAGHQRVPETFLADLPFPRLSIEKQNQLVDHMSAARSARRAKLAAADALLAGLDDYLLGTLSITLPPIRNASVYAISANNVGKRIDAYSNQSRFRKLFNLLHHSGYPVLTFGELSNCIFSGITPLAKGDSYETPPDGVRFIRSGEITSDGEVTPVSEVHIRKDIHDGMMKRSQLKRGDLLIAIVGATIGAAGIFNRSEPANINQAIAVVRLKDAAVSSEYACLYLRSCVGQALLDYYKRPVARANINLEEIAEIPLVIPTKDIQLKIVEESHQLRDEARRLRVDAEAEWHAAKRWFEEQLFKDIQ
jgi:type I restriction enzyme S subunit